MPSAIRFHCLGCRARITAPVQLLDQVRPCPGCGTLLLVRPEPPADSGCLMANERRPLPPWRARAAAGRVS